MIDNQNQNHHLALFKGKTIRKTLYKKEWWFSILDIIGVLTDSPQPKTYWAKMKERDVALTQSFPFWEQFCSVFIHSFQFFRFGIYCKWI